MKINTHTPMLVIGGPLSGRIIEIPDGQTEVDLRSLVPPCFVAKAPDGLFIYRVRVMTFSGAPTRRILVWGRLEFHEAMDLVFTGYQKRCRVRRHHFQAEVVEHLRAIAGIEDAAVADIREGRINDEVTELLGGTDGIASECLHWMAMLKIGLLELTPVERARVMVVLGAVERLSRTIEEGGVAPETGGS